VVCVAIEHEDKPRSMQFGYLTTCLLAYQCACHLPAFLLLPGAALYPSSLLQSVYADLLAKTYGNPHSAAAASTSPEALSSGAASGGPSSSSSGTRVGPAAASEAVMEQAALAVLSHFNADPAEYQVVFTRCGALVDRGVVEASTVWPALSSMPVVVGECAVLTVRLLHGVMR
jgi:hypothetical protein